MFKLLHTLAASATLMITASAEDDLLRITITPTSNDDKKKPALKPLSLLASPEELDAEFENVIAAWQAPRKSLMEQVEDAKADDDDKDKPADKQKPAAKTAQPAAAKKEAKAATPAKAKPETKAAAKKPDAAKTVLNPAAQWPFPGTQSATNAEAKATDAGADTGALVDPRQTSLIEGTDTGSTPPTGVLVMTGEEKIGEPDAAPAATEPAAAPVIDLDLF